MVNHDQHLSRVQVDLYATLALLLFVIPFVIFYLILKDYVALVSLRIS